MPHFYLNRRLSAPRRVSVSLACCAALVALSPFILASFARAQDTPKPAPANGARRVSVKPIDPAPFTAFSAWAVRYAAAKGDARAALETEGARLAARRSSALREAVETNTPGAVALALTPETTKALPASVAGLVETPFAGLGDLDVLIADYVDPKTGAMTHGQIMRRLTINGKTYAVVAYGRRANLTTKRNLPVSGFILAGVAVLRAESVRALPAGATVPVGAPVGNPDKICPIAKTDASSGVIGEMGGTYYYFATTAALREFAEAQEARENVIGPDAGSVVAE